eukprot:scaffold34322_cov160-Skeletonema_menzelii.AAC.3
MDVDKDKHRHVDIATLSIPAAVAATGFEVGDGTDFVLEAPTRVIDQLLEYNDSPNNQTHISAAPCIEGVLDLTAATRLLPGISEGELVKFLHEDDVASTSIPGHHDQDEEKGHLLGDSTNSGDTDNATAFVSVAADAFVHTHQDVGDDTRHKAVTQSSFCSSIQTAGGMHEAFLLNIPEHRAGSVNKQQYGGTNKGDTDGKFVLALPEVAGTTSFRTSAATHTIVNEGAFAPLPTDVAHVELQVSTIIVPNAHGESLREVHLDLVVDRKVPLVGYVILVSGLFALASIGAALDLQHGQVTPEMKIFWRLTSTSILFFFPAVKSGKIDLSGLSSFEMFIVLPFAAMNYAIMNTSFAASLEFTSLVNAMILSNLASLIIILSKLVLGARVAALEGMGTAVGLIGASICAMAPAEVSDDENNDVGSRAMIGNLLALLSSIGVSVYLTAAKNLRPKIDLFLFMFLIFVQASVFQLAYIIFSGQPYEYSTDDEIGLFGWTSLRKDRLFLELYVAVVCNGVGTAGYVAIMKYFDPVVVAMVMLMEPVVALFQGIAVGVATLPGWITWLGNTVVVSGSLLVIWSGSKKTETVDATDALHQTDNDLMKSLSFKGSRLMKRPMIPRERAMTEETEFVPVRGQSVGPKK